jgi:hypothetical protein
MISIKNILKLFFNIFNRLEEMAFFPMLPTDATTLVGFQGATFSAVPRTAVGLYLVGPGIRLTAKNYDRLHEAPDCGTP